MLLTMLFSVAKMNAQVTIGADVEPNPFSVLELYAEYDTYLHGGLRLPQMTTTQRNELTATYTFTTNAGAYGLMIYNTTVNCVEYWNSKKWVSLCLGTANITLEGPCDYTTPIPANGIATTECVYTPVDDPACTVTSGQAY